MLTGIHMPGTYQINKYLIINESYPNSSIPSGISPSGVFDTTKAKLTEQKNLSGTPNFWPDRFFWSVTLYRIWYAINDLIFEYYSYQIC